MTKWKEKVLTCRYRYQALHHDTSTRVTSSMYFTPLVVLDVVEVVAVHRRFTTPDPMEKMNEMFGFPLVSVRVPVQVPLLVYVSAAPYSIAIGIAGTQGFGPKVWISIWLADSNPTSALEAPSSACALFLFKFVPSPTPLRLKITRCGHPFFRYCYCLLCECGVCRVLP
eukprot:GSA25T00009279001.1